MLYRVWLSFLWFSMLAFPFEHDAPLAQGSNTARVNKNTVRLISGGVEGTYVQIASDLSQALDEKYEFRVVPIIGKGSKTNIEDLLFLQGVDLAIVQSDVLNFFGRNSDDKIPGIERKLLYITKLYNEEIHLIAGPGIGSIEDLEGRKVAYGPEGGGSAMTAENIFDGLGIHVDFADYPYTQALKELLAGNVAALVHVVGKTLDDYEEIPPEAGLRLLSLPLDLIEEPYQPASFSDEDYPGLVPEGETVNTLSIPSVLAAYNWDASPWCPDRDERKRKVGLFANKLFEGLDELKSVDDDGDPRFHEKWQEVDLRADVPPWQRLPEMSRLLDIEPDGMPPPVPCQ